MRDEREREREVAGGGNKRERSGALSRQVRINDLGEVVGRSESPI